MNGPWPFKEMGHGFQEHWGYIYSPYKMEFLKSLYKKWPEINGFHTGLIFLKPL